MIDVVTLLVRPALRRPFVIALLGLCVATAQAEVPADLRAALDAPDADPVALGEAVARAAAAMDDGFGDSRVDVRMRLHDGRGNVSERELRIRSLEMADDGDRSLIIFDSPPDQRGTALLTWSHRAEDDDQWLYLPVLRRVKKIAARNKSGPFVGSEFAFEDLTSEEVEKYRWRYLDRVPCGALECLRVERVPEDRYSGYSRQEVFYDTEALRVQRIEYFDRKGAHIKTLVASDWEQFGDTLWRAHAMQMHNHQNDRRTELLWGDYAFGTGLDDGDFNAAALRRVR